MTSHRDFYFAFYTIEEKKGKPVAKLASKVTSLSKFVSKEALADKSYRFACQPKSKGPICSSRPALWSTILLPCFMIYVNSEDGVKDVRYDIEVSVADFSASFVEDVRLPSGSWKDLKKSKLASKIWKCYRKSLEEEALEKEARRPPPHEDHDFIFFNQFDDGVSYEVRSIRSLEVFSKRVAENLTESQYRNKDCFWFAHCLKTKDMDDNIIINDTRPFVQLFRIAPGQINVKVSWDEHAEETQTTRDEELADKIWETYGKVHAQID